MPCLSCLLVPVLSCIRVVRAFSRLVLMEVVLVSPRKLLEMCARSCLSSLCLIAHIVFLMVLRVSVLLSVCHRFMMNFVSSACSLVVLALSWCCSFCVVDALMENGFFELVIGFFKVLLG